MEISMSIRCTTILLLAVILSSLNGCVSEAQAVEESIGFWPGLSDGFLIFVEFFSGQLGDPHYFDRPQAGSSYYLGYLCGAMAFLTIGTLISLR
jgi:hypothetical protein